MKKFKFAAIILIISIALSFALAPGALALTEPEVSAGAAVLFERNTRETLFELNADTRMYPASTTKIMTVLLAIEAVEAGQAGMDDPVTAGDTFHQAYEDDGSTANITAGETMTLRDLMYCALLASANEACNIIAQYISGSIESFVALMNQRAAELGCTGTHFANTHGYQDANHYTTARDMSLIADECADHKSFMEICGAATYTVPATDVSEARELSNSNALINEKSVYGENYKYDAATGMKTGRTSDAGYCLVSTATKNGIDLVCVVLGCTAPQNEDGSYDVGNFSNTIKLMDWGFDNFSYQDILSSSTIVARVSVGMAKDTDYVSLHAQSSIRLFLPNDYDLTQFEQQVIVYSERDGQSLVAPISAGDVLGEVKLLRDGAEVDTVPLVATASVSLSKAAYIKTQIASSLESPTLRRIVRILIILFALYLLWVIIYRVRRIVHQVSVRKARRERARNVAEREAQRAQRQPAYAGRQRAPDIDFFTGEGSSAEDIDAQSYEAPAPEQSGNEYYEAPEAEPEWEPETPQSDEPESVFPEQPPEAPEAKPQKSDEDADFFEQLFR